VPLVLVALTRNRCRPSCAGVGTHVSTPDAESIVMPAGAMSSAQSNGAVPVAENTCENGTPTGIHFGSGERTILVFLPASATVTVKLPVDVLPRVSLAEHATVVVPIGNVEPDAGVQVTGRAPSTTSLAVAVKLAMAPVGPVEGRTRFPGNVRVGPVVSCTVTVKLPVDVLPCVSLAEHVTVVVPIGNAEPDAGVHVTGRGPSMASVAVAVNVATAPAPLVASTTRFAGSVSAGPAASVTVTVNKPDAELPCRSLAEHATVVVPIGNVLPEAGVQVTGTAPSIASIAVAVNVTTAPAVLVAAAVMFAGSVSTGPAVSCTVTVKRPVDELSCVSLAEHVTVVVPSGNVLPEAGVHVAGTGPSIASVAVAVNVTTAPAVLVAGVVMFAGSVSTGPAVSCTVTVKLPVDSLPHVSLAEHVTIVVPSGNALPEAGMHVTGTGPSIASVAVAV
jgi:hypothetical protein